MAPDALPGRVAAVLQAAWRALSLDSRAGSAGLSWAGPRSGVGVRRLNSRSKIIRAIGGAGGDTWTQFVPALST